jgi:hypothetical protein
VRLVEDGRGREEAEEKDETRRNTLTEGGKTQQHCSTWIPYSFPLPLYCFTLSRENDLKILVHFSLFLY